MARKDDKKKENPAQEPEIEASAEETVKEAAPSAEETLALELKAEKEKYLRLAAEYDNYRKRSAKEREALFSDVRVDTISKLLPVYDNLARALEQETADTAYKRGVELTMNQLLSIFSDLGVTPIEALGQTFDPALHNAVMHIDDEEHGESEIVMEFQKGFRLGEKIIRFSTVQVAN